MVWVFMSVVDEVESFDVSLEKQEVIVRGPIGYDDLLAKIKKTGKEVCAPYVKLYNQI